MEDIILDSEKPILLQQEDKNHDSRERKLEIEVGEEEEHKKKKAKGEEEEEKTGGRVLNNIFSSLVSPKGKEKENEEKAQVEEEDKVGNNESGGGLISNFVSTIFHKEESVKVEEKVKEEKSIIREIAAHLPKSLPDDGLTNDEASILIHSIIHD